MSQIEFYNLKTKPKSIYSYNRSTENKKNTARSSVGIYHYLSDFETFIHNKRTSKD